MLVVCITPSQQISSVLLISCAALVGGWLWSSFEKAIQYFEKVQNVKVDASSAGFFTKAIQAHLERHDMVWLQPLTLTEECCDRI